MKRKQFQLSLLTQKDNGKDFANRDWNYKLFKAIGFRNNNITDMQAQMRVFIFFFLENEMFIR